MAHLLQQGEIQFQGFEGELLDLNGPYARAQAVNHGKPTFKKIDSGNQSVMVYYWDERDGVQLRGWWVAPEVGGSNVWAMSTATSPMPPHSGWRVPWHGEVNKKVTLTKISSNPGMLAQAATVAPAKRMLDRTEPNWDPHAPTANPQKFQKLGAGQAGFGWQGKSGGAGKGLSISDYEKQRKEQEDRRREQEGKRREIIEQQRQERKLAESINGCVLATSNAERAYMRVKDSQAATNLFNMETMKPADLARYSSEVEKGLKAALCSLTSAETLQQRKQQDLESATASPGIQLETLQTQLNESKTKLEACQNEANQFQTKVTDRQKVLWSNLVGDIVEKSEKEMTDAEQSIEDLKDRSALLSSEIAEHLSPEEAIDAADQAHESSVKADQKISQCRDNLHQRRTEVMTAMNFYKPAPGEDQLNLADKKTKIEKWLTKVGPMMEEVTRIRQLAIHIGNRARQAEAIRKKQELKERQKRKNERRAKWNKQLIQDLGSEVTLCVDFLQSAEEMRRQGVAPEKINGTFLELKKHLEKAKRTFEDFKTKQETMNQTIVEIDRWGKRITELEEVLLQELGKDAEMKKQKQRAEIPGNLVIAGLLLKFMDVEGKSKDDLFKDISSLGTQGADPNGARFVSTFKLQEFLKKHPGHFSAGSLQKNLTVDMPPSLNPKTPNNVPSILNSHLRDAFDEVDLPIGAVGEEVAEKGKKRSQLNELLFQCLHRKFFVYEAPPPPEASGRAAAPVKKGQNFGRDDVEGVMKLVLTPNLEDDDANVEDFPVLEHRTIFEMAGPLEYVVKDDKSKVRMFVKTFDKDGEERTGYITYYLDGKKQVQEITTLKCYTETVLTQNAELKGIKMIRRVRKEEYFRMLDLSPKALNPMVRIFAYALSDEKSGYVTVSNNQNFYLKCEDPPKPKNAPLVEKTIPVLGSVRVSMGEAVSVKDRKTGEWKIAFLVERVGKDGKTVSVAIEEDESLMEVSTDDIRSKYDEKKKIELSSVTKETLQQLTRDHFSGILEHPDLLMPSVPSEELVPEETIALCIEQLKDSQKVQKHLDLFKLYMTRREIRFLVLGEPSIYTEVISKFNESVHTLNKLRLKMKHMKDAAEKKLLELEEEKRQAAQELERKDREEREATITVELESLKSQTIMFHEQFETNLKTAVEPPDEDKDWDVLIGDCQHSLAECQKKKSTAIDFIGVEEKKIAEGEEAGIENPELRAVLTQAKKDLQAIGNQKDGTCEDRLEKLQRKAFEGVFDKYVVTIRDFISSSPQTEEELFEKLIEEQAQKTSSGTAEKASEAADGEKSEKILSPEALKAKFPTSFTPKPMNLEQFKMFVGSYYILTKEVALTTGVHITEGQLIRKLPQWTLVQLAGESHTDKETENSRRHCKVVTLPCHDTTTAAAAAEDDKEDKEAKEHPEGYITVFDKQAAESNLKVFGIGSLTSPVCLQKDTVMTTEGELQVKFDVIRRIKSGEKLEIMGLPILIPSQMLRVKARALNDGKVGWFTIYDHKWRQGYISM